MNHLDLFSGIGGFSLGLHQAGITPDWIGYSDIDKYANELFQRRFTNARRLGSITDVRPNDLPNIDLITFGFPCQDLSIAGKRGGLSANRSSLFFKAIELVAAKRPKYFIFENVKGLFSSNGGKDFDIVLRSIADIGYDGQWQLLNTRWFLPQNRERVYFVGHIRGECRPKVFPIGEDEGKVKQSRKDEARISAAPSREFGWKEISPTLCARDYKDPKLVKQKKVIQVADYRNDEGLRVRKDGVSPCLATRRHSETDISTMPPILKIHTTQPRSGNPNKGGTGPLSRDDGITYCLDTGNSQAVELEKSNIRRLTPIECERLQGFPDGWTEGQSDTQRYKQLGNAVTVPVVKAIMERLYNAK